MGRALPDILAEQGWEPGPLVGWRKDDRSLYINDERGLEHYINGSLKHHVLADMDERTAVDVLCALGVLPAELSSMWLGGFRLGMAGAVDGQYRDRNDMPADNELVPATVESWLPDHVRGGAA